MGEAKRRKARLGDAYGAPVHVMIPSTTQWVAEHLSREDCIDLVEHCKKPGPWERRYTPIDKYRSLYKEVVITCFVECDLLVCFWPACFPDQAPSRIPAPLTLDLAGPELAGDSTKDSA
jgi:hypothetical protein